MKLSPIEAQAVALLVAIPTSGGVKKFALFPRSKDWADVASGRLEVTKLDAYHHYEMVNTASGPEYRHDPGGQRYGDAISAAI